MKILEYIRSLGSIGEPVFNISKQHEFEKNKAYYCEQFPQLASWFDDRFLEASKDSDALARHQIIMEIKELEAEIERNTMYLDKFKGDVKDRSVHLAQMIDYLKKCAEEKPTVKSLIEKILEKVKRMRNAGGQWRQNVVENDNMEERDDESLEDKKQRLQRQLRLLKNKIEVLGEENSRIIASIKAIKAEVGKIQLIASTLNLPEFSPRKQGENDEGPIV